ncbi:MAG: T9SS type A sorting domain-containing protein [bacterium]
MKFRLFLCLALGIPMGALSQWSSDPSVNTMVAGTGLDRTFPKIIASPQGTFYISNWQQLYDKNDNYHLWLQQVDANGYLLWGTDGIQVSDQPCDTWLSDYSLKVDNTGNAILAMEDLRGGTGFSHVSVYSIAPDKHAVWDTNGIQVNMGDYDSHSPVIALTNDHNVLVAWNGDRPDIFGDKFFIRIQKLSPEGVPLWTEPISVTDGDSTSIFPNLLPVGDDEFILVWQRKFEKGTGLGREWYTYIYAQRYDANGQPVWPNKVAICDHGDSAYVVPEFIILYPVQDEHQGIIVAWPDDRFETDYSNIYIQQVDSAGNLKWPVNGIAVSPFNAGYDRVEPMVAFEPASQATYVFWDEYRAIGIYDSFGMLGQKIGADGSLRWGDLGKVFAGFTMDTIWYLTSTKETPSGDMVLLVDRGFDSIIGPDTVTFDQLFAMRIDTAGNLTWPQHQALMAATEGTKFYPRMSDLSGDIYVVSWGENRNSQFDPEGAVFAQNITLDGNLGPAGIPQNSGTEQEISIRPNPTAEGSWLVFYKPVSGTVDLALFSSAGQLIFSSPVRPESQDQKIWLDTGLLSSGMYMVRIRNQGKESHVKWLIIR